MELLEASLLFSLYVKSSVAKLGLAVASAESQLWETSRIIKTYSNVCCSCSQGAERPVLTSDSSARRVWPVLSSWLAFLFCYFLIFIELDTFLMFSVFPALVPQLSLQIAHIEICCSDTPRT